MATRSSACPPERGRKRGSSSSRSDTPSDPLPRPSGVLVLGQRSGADPADPLRTLLSRYEAHGFSGVVLVAKDGRVILHEGYGYADREKRARDTRETTFEIGSLTKTFTAAAILRLEADGQLRTDDPIARHLGPFPEGKAAATIHHLATHTAGLVPEGRDLGPGDDRDRFLRAVKEVPRESAPGEAYRYTGTSDGTIRAAAASRRAEGCRRTRRISFTIQTSGS